MINHVLNTRLVPALPRWRDGENHGRRAAGKGRRNARTDTIGVKGRLETFEALRPSPLAEGEPLPPDDRVVVSTPLLDRLYREQAGRLRRFFARRTAAQDVGDLVHDSFARLAGSRPADGRDVICSEAYLQTVAQNVLRNRARAAFYRTTSPLTPDDELSHLTADLTALLETRDELARVERALHKLAPKTRQIFIAHRLDGVTYAEIAAQTGLSVKTIEWHMSKAIAWLHRACGPR